MVVNIFMVFYPFGSVYIYTRYLYMYCIVYANQDKSRLLHFIM